MLTLSSERFRDLSRLTKLEGGRPLKVVDQTSLGAGVFAQFSPWAQPVIFDSREQRTNWRGQAMSVVEVANQIDPERFWCTERPEMDWSAIPRTKIYPFLIHHEIGHIRHGVATFLLRGLMEGREVTHETMWQDAIGRSIHEALADRYAWRRLFPGRRFPVSKAPTLDSALVTRYTADFPNLFPLKPKAVKALPSEDYAYVPQAHIDPGIPWVRI